MEKPARVVWTRVVIAGATNALGAEVARQFATKGSCFLILIGSSTDKEHNTEVEQSLTNLSNECRKLGALDVLIHIFEGSPTHAAYMKLMTEIKSGYGGIDILAFTLGITVSSNLSQIPQNNIEKMVTSTFDLSYLSAVICTQTAFSMLQDGKGILIVFHNTEEPKNFSNAASMSLLVFFKNLEKEKDKRKFKIQFCDTTSFEADKAIDANSSVHSVNSNKKVDVREVSVVCTDLSKTLSEAHPVLKKKTTSFDVLGVFRKKKK